ncbi:MAG: hypothetical protein ACREUT_20760 [Steroidobacteraceae bacterium]
MSRSSRLVGAAALCAFGVALMWPAFFNGQPIFFGDTSAYIRGADAGVQAFFHRRSAWSLSGADAIVPGSSPVRREAAPGSQRHGSSIAEKSVVSGRSPYYGAILYLGDLIGGFWLSIAVQAAAVVLSIVLVCRAVGAVLSPRMVAVGAVLAAATTAPFFVSFLEPDVFAGVAVLTCAALLGGADRLRRLELAAACALLFVCVVVHESHVLIVGVLLVLGLLGRFLTRPLTPRWVSLGILTAAVGVAAAASLLFGAAVKHVIGAPPLRPPFLMARMIDDGPGYRYLRTSCPGSGFTVCAYLDRLPVAANLFLWDPGPHGVFSAVSPAVRRQLAAEQTRFVLAVLRHEPWAEIGHALRNAGLQLTMAGLDEFRYPPGLKRDFAASIPREPLARMRRTAAYRGTMPIALFSVVTLTTFALGTAIVLIALLWPAWRRRLPPRLVAVAIWTLAGVLINGAVCGMLSGPHNRYAARVSWVMPAVALFIALATLARWSPGREQERERERRRRDDCAIEPPLAPPA